MDHYNTFVYQNTDNSRLDDICEENKDYYEYINQFSEYIIDENQTNQNQKNQKNSKFFTYCALDYLVKDVPVEINYGQIVNICPYIINTTGKFPFLQFVLKNTFFLFENNLSFLSFFYMENKDVLETSKSKLKELMMLYSNINGELNSETKSENNSSEKKELYEYTGYTIINGEVYMFFDCSNYEIQLQELYQTNSCWLVLLDEIINHTNVCGIPIAKKVTEFCFFNKELGLLLDEEGDVYEIPVVAYCYQPKHMLEFTGVFGQCKSDNDAIAGPFYYFTSFAKACEMSKKEEHGGIVRFALFLGNMRVALNLERDDVDFSQMKKTLLQENSNEIDSINSINSIVRQTLRLSDHDGNWTKDYDSYYIGKLELDNGMVFPDGPLWVIKKYEQQIPVSFHHMSKYRELSIE